MKLVKEFIKANIIIFLILFIFNFIDSLFNLKSILASLSGVFGIIISSIVGGVILGNPIAGYVICSELIKLGVPKYIVASFVLSWLTVGFLQIPLESQYLGTKFSIRRNLVALILSILFGLICFILF